jgi:hypothetical protein
MELAALAAFTDEDASVCEEDRDDDELAAFMDDDASVCEADRDDIEVGHLIFGHGWNVR